MNSGLIKNYNMIFHYLLSFRAREDGANVQKRGKYNTKDGTIFIKLIFKRKRKSSGQFLGSWLGEKPDDIISAFGAHDGQIRLISSLKSARKHCS